MRSRPAAVAADLLAVIVFVLLGRRSHDEGSAVAGTVATAWPFVAGAVAGEVLVAAARRPPDSFVAGAVVAASTTVWACCCGGWPAVAPRSRSSSWPRRSSRCSCRVAGRASGCSRPAEAVARRRERRRARRALDPSAPAPRSRRRVSGCAPTTCRTPPPPSSCGGRAVTCSCTAGRRRRTSGRGSSTAPSAVCCSPVSRRTTPRAPRARGGSRHRRRVPDPLARPGTAMASTHYLAHVYRVTWDGAVIFNDGEVEAAWWEAPDAVRPRSPTRRPVRARHPLPAGLGGARGGPRLTRPEPAGTAAAACRAPAPPGCAAKPPCAGRRAALRAQPRGRGARSSRARVRTTPEHRRAPAVVVTAGARRAEGATGTGPCWRRCRSSGRARCPACPG